ncbi:hypothetical protein HDU87_005093 [Geranomyces variabilis]|uniref:Uncharacterized protein n=1 Tax=Geranomyces variabilis TaxID=109894 RepID=A0AAD5TR61_9FUNG|nr:hypothetical protein HDU87_005093 [Geranomyces variabilis]
MSNPNSAAARHRSLLTASGHRVVVGIDFGTSHSGFAYAHVADPGSIEMNYDWEDQMQPYCKNSTSLWYDIQAKKTESWGYTAVANAMECTDAQSPCQLLQLFKLCVEPSCQDHGVRMPEGVDPLDIVSEYLKELFTTLLHKLQERFGQSLQAEDIHYCLTVPAIWSETAKQRMRQCAVQAGLISSTEINMPRLTLVLEPEAAAVYCCKRMTEAQMRSGDTFMVVDAGGGTVDIVVQKWSAGVANQRLSELARGEGDWCGSTFIDTRFLEWFATKVGTDALTNLKAERGRDYMHILKQWEAMKRQFKGPETFAKTSFQPFSIPGALYNYMSDEAMATLEREQDGTDDDVYIKLNDMLTFFDPVVNKTLDLIQTQLDKVPGKRCNKLFAVGGFSASPYLTSKICGRFSGSFDKLIFPREPGAAVVYGLEPNSIQARASRLSYGLLLCRPEEHFKTQNALVNPKDVFKHTEEDRNYVEYFQPAITAGQIVSVDDSYKTKCYPVYTNQTCVTVSVYATVAEVNNDTSFSSIPGRFDVGFIPIDNVPLTGDRTITVHMYFGLTELTVIATINQTGAEKRIAVNFSTR